MTAAEVAAKAFAEAFGGAPEGVWAAPGRVNVIGEHTDYNDGFVLPVALPQTTRAAVARRDDGLVALVSAQHPGARVQVPAPVHGLPSSHVSPTSPVKPQAPAWLQTAFRH